MADRERDAAKKQRVYTYDNLKFWLIALVVIIHCADFYKEEIPAFRSIYNFIYLFAMPAFVFVSGLFSGNTLRDGRRTRQRTVYFLILYLLCELFLSIPQMFLHGQASLSLFCEAGIPWYMLSMAFWFAATYFLREVEPRFLLALSVLLACFAGYDSSIGDFLCLSKTLVFYPFFLAGRLMDYRRLSDWFGGEKERRGSTALKIAGWAGLLLLAAVCILKRDFMYSLRPLFSGRDPFAALPVPALGALYRLGYYAVNAVVIFCLLAAVPKRKTAFSGLGTRTLQVYFLHYYAIYPLNLLHAAKRLQAFLPDAACAAVICALAVLIMVILAQKPFSRPFAALERLCNGQPPQKRAASGQERSIQKSTN